MKRKGKFGLASLVLVTFIVFGACANKIYNAVPINDYNRQSTGLYAVTKDPKNSNPEKSPENSKPNKYFNEELGKVFLNLGICLFP